MRNVGVLGLSVARSEIDNFVQKDSKQTLAVALFFRIGQNFVHA